MRQDVARTTPAVGKGAAREQPNLTIDHTRLGTGAGAADRLRGLERVISAALAWEQRRSCEDACRERGTNGGGVRDAAGHPGGAWHGAPPVPLWNLSGAGLTAARLKDAVHALAVWGCSRASCRAGLPDEVVEVRAEAGRLAAAWTAGWS